MIHFKEFWLNNGLQVIVHEDPSVQIAVLNLLYKVGSRDEDPTKTGFAHLFEHLMFGGSINVENFDSELQKVGGDNNAFTSPDITNYYITVPHQNIECAFWLESDRMLGLPFSDKVLEVQKNVVIEEFKQRYLNQPYGDLWLKMRPLAYQKHSYRWATIGKEISHIENATQDDVKAFYNKYYTPNNAVLVVAGNVTVSQVKKLSEKWFSDIPSGQPIERNYKSEPLQNQKRELVITANVPADMLTMAFHMPARFAEGYHTADLVSDILGREKSSRLYNALVRDSEIFKSINAYVMGSLDPGLLVISGKLSSGVSTEQGEKEIWNVINLLQNSGLEKQELDKVRNQAESTLAFGEVEVLNRAMTLAYSALSGDVNHCNEEINRIRAVEESDIMKMVNELLIEKNCSVLHYKSN
ncbi:MAG: pitrilysin family protein [Fulvivirga sp.]|uniref:M16 family metallopeptidase n=1 Tax=Fulvivirga sp. TaxID=1931237 RepID=UPI0032EBFDBA